jgi:glycosyltransferase involved in cell wall biosynthesis
MSSFGLRTSTSSPFVVGVLGAYPPPYGGVSISIKQCSEIWASKGHEIHVMNFLRSGDTRVIKKVFIHDVAVDKSVGKKVLSAFFGLTFRRIKRVFFLFVHGYSLPECMGYLSIVRRVENICKRYGVDVLHSHNLLSLESAIACACSKDFGVPFVVTGYGEAWQFRDDGKKLGLMRHIAHSAAHVTATSEHCKRGIVEFLGLPSERVSVIYAGVDTERYNPKVKAVRLKEKYGINDEKVVLFVGHLHPRKGLQYAVRAMPLVFREVKDVKLLVVGPDYWGHRTEFEDLASQLGVSDRVIFAGEVDEEELPAHYSLADVLVFPSTTLVECMGMTLKQAMVAGIPVVGAKMGGVPEAIVDGETGYLARPNDEVDLAEKIVELLRDEKLMREMGLKGRERALKLFRKETMANRLLKVYSDVLENRF